MKNAFKFLGIMLIAMIFVFVGCGPKPLGDDDGPIDKGDPVETGDVRTEPGTGPNLTDKFEAPKNRRVPQTSFTSAEFSGTITWYYNYGDGVRVQINPTKEIFASDDKAFIDAVVSVTGGNFSSDDFWYMGSVSELVENMSTTSAKITVKFNPIPEPKRVSVWWRAHGDESGLSFSEAGYTNGDKPKPDFSYFYWIHFFDDGSWYLYNSRHNKGGRKIAAEGYYTYTGSASHIESGDQYTVTFTWIDVLGVRGNIAQDEANKYPNIILVGNAINDPTYQIPYKEDHRFPSGGGNHVPDASNCSFVRNGQSCPGGVPVLYETSQANNGITWYVQAGPSNSPYGAWNSGTKLYIPKRWQDTPDDLYYTRYQDPIDDKDLFTYR